MQQILFFLKEFIQRIKSENPPFFKKLQILFGLIATFIGLGILLKWNIPAINGLFTIEWFVFFAGSVVASRLPNSDVKQETSDDEGNGGSSNP